MQERLVEIWVGVFVVIALLASLFLALQVSGLAELRQTPGYQVVATFDNVGGLRERAPVRMAGVRVGRVERIELDPQSHQARVVLRIDERYDSIPVDTRAAIYTSGLLGEQYIGLEAGWEEEALSAGDRLQETQSAVVLERLIGQFVRSMGE
ncbi:outer membrane lipid asymmetry maintenance protein MlaD [Halorhodospira abdelmalekii]|uniref:outer membrane lipid asymmetry maintenance protein MlaD n=1 Tax=Halorhodospira abdelmalekii TaxID=421629 RepID=UPI0019038376|nr:outer membrane lipid asymmetry maintenance protein MlaD [Halorhodospira abdelmalekii]MBK1734090.1 outer membrane lipid asymmetry maintenance protein MlaD [Halorhodospira abdelmalekii]